MLHMEGTRHERVMMVVSAYVIGFTTAFIAFGVNQISNTSYVAEAPAGALVQQTASVINATESEPPAPTTIETVTIDQDGLWYTNQLGAVRLVTAYDPVSAADGHYQSILEYQLSADETMLYFCEVPTATADACKPFLYDANEDVVYPVTVSGERIALPLDAVTLTWDDGQLVAITDLPIDPVPVAD